MTPPHGRPVRDPGLTDDQLAAQEGAFDDPAANVPLPAPKPLTVDELEFLLKNTHWSYARGDEALMNKLAAMRDALAAEQAAADAAGEEPGLAPRTDA